MVDRLFVTGFLGAGKSSLAAHLIDQGGPDVVELEALADPAHQDSARLICVVDAANLRRWLGDDNLAPLVRQQIQCAGMIVLTRSDLVDAAEATTTLHGLTNAPLHDTPFGGLPLAALDDMVSRPQPAPVGDLFPDFTHWTYQGPAVLQPDIVEELLRTRPKGVLRMTGTVRIPDGGLEVEIVGRSRQTRQVSEPESTTLRACGLDRDFSTTAMDVRFAEAAADSVARSGLFRYR